MTEREQQPSSIDGWLRRNDRIDNELAKIDEADDIEINDRDTVRVQPDMHDGFSISITWLWNGEAENGSMWNEQLSTHGELAERLDDVTDCDDMECRTYEDRMSVTLIYEQ